MWRMIIVITWCILSSFFLIFVIGSESQAMTVNPLAIEMTASGPNTKSTISVMNDTTAPIPVELQVFKITLDQDGEIHSVPAEDSFLIFPSQKIIPAGASQSFRIQWLGKPNIPESQSYLVSVRQVPVNLGANKSGVQMVFNFSVVVNVAPLQATGALEVVAADIVNDRGTRKVRLTVKNTGKRHILLSEGAISLSSDSWTVLLNRPELRASLGLGLLQPGRTRHFLLNTDIPGNVDRINVDLRHEGLVTAGVN